MAGRGGARKAWTAAALAAAAVGMAGLAYASVPLYRWFCQATGFGGTPQVADRAPDRVLDREVTVRFNADVNSRLPWSFQPVQRRMRVRLGERALAEYRAVNEGGRAVTGTATFNVTPAKAGLYFSKIDCFCFAEQRLEAGQSALMPVSFYVDPALALDRNMDDVTAITLSYTFFAAPGEQTAEAAGAGPARTGTN